MNQKQISIIKQQFTISNGRPTITSLKVAEAFGKEHKNVLRDIEGLECSLEFNQLNFERVEYKDAKGEMRPMFNIHKDGFILLVMGYQGRAAFRLKEAYIMAFNAMEAELRSGMASTRAAVADAMLVLCAEASKSGYPADFVPQLVRYRRLGLTHVEIGKLLDMGKDAVAYWLKKCLPAGLVGQERVAKDFSAKLRRQTTAAAQNQLSLPGMEVQA